MKTSALITLCLFCASLGFALAGGVTVCVEASRDYERKKQMDRMSEEFDETITAINNVCRTAKATKPAARTGSNDWENGGNGKLRTGPAKDWYTRCDH